MTIEKVIMMFVQRYMKDGYMTWSIAVWGVDGSGRTEQPFNSSEKFIIVSLIMEESRYPRLSDIYMFFKLLCMKAGILSRAQLHLTSPLVKHALDSERMHIGNITREQVAVYLKDMLHWKAVDVSRFVTFSPPRPSRFVSLTYS
jgi:hypothetical protein